MWVRFLGWEDALEEGMATYSSILAGESHGQRRQALCSFMECSQPRRHLTVGLLSLCFPDKDLGFIQVTPRESQS